MQGPVVGDKDKELCRDSRTNSPRIHGNEEHEKPISKWRSLTHRRLSSDFCLRVYMHSHSHTHIYHKHIQAKVDNKAALRFRIKIRKSVRENLVLITGGMAL